MEESPFQTVEIKEKLDALSERAFEQMKTVKDARTKALLLTMADLISGLKCAYENYESTCKETGAPVVKPAPSPDSYMFL